MLWQSDLLLVLFGFLIIYFLCKWLNQEWQIQTRYRQLITYFSDVLDNSMRNGAQQVQIATPLLTQLNNYSQKIQSWYEQVSTDTATDDTGNSSSDDEDEGDSQSESENFPQKCKIVQETKGMRSVGIQSDNKTGSWIVNQGNETRQKYSQNSWRSNQFYSTGNNQENSCDLQTIRRLQDDQLKMLLKQVRYFGQRDMRSPLILCVEANSTNISGYLINLKQKTCKFYVFGIQHLPWKLETSSVDWDTTEFKMKNVIFALLLWEQEIFMMKKFSLFANCWAINQVDCRFGKIAVDFLEHFTSCENIIRVNSNCQVSRIRDTSLFAKLIQPARDLMYWNLSRFRHYIRKAYGILEFDGSHSFLDNFQSSAKDDGYYAKSFRHDYFLTKVKKNAEKWARKECKKCDLKFSNRMMDLKSDLTSGSDGESSDSGIMPYPLTDNNW